MPLYDNCDTRTECQWRTTTSFSHGTVHYFRLFVRLRSKTVIRRLTIKKNQWLTMNITHFSIHHKFGNFIWWGKQAPYLWSFDVLVFNIHRPKNLDVLKFHLFLDDLCDEKYKNLQDWKILLCHAKNKKSNCDKFIYDYAIINVYLNIRKLF